MVRGGEQVKMDTAVSRELSVLCMCVWVRARTRCKQRYSCPCACSTEHDAMKVYWGSRGIAPLILDLSTR